MKPASDAQKCVDQAKMTGLGIWVPGPRKGWRRRGNAGIYRNCDSDNSVHLTLPIQHDDLVGRPCRPRVIHYLVDQTLVEELSAVVGSNDCGGWRKRVISLRCTLPPPNKASVGCVRTILKTKKKEKEKVKMMTTTMMVMRVTEKSKEWELRSRRCISRIRAAQLGPVALGD